jgi:hypothetical protein
MSNVKTAVSAIGTTIGLAAGFFAAPLIPALAALPFLGILGGRIAGGAVSSAVVGGASYAISAIVQSDYWLE